MYLVFPLKTLAYIFGIPLLLAFSVLFLLGKAPSLSLFSMSILITIILFWLIEVTAVWRKIWKWKPQLNEWIFPDINGLWQGSQQSNWPVIKSLKDSAMSNHELFDCERSGVELLETAVKVRVKASLFKIQVELISPPRPSNLNQPYSESKTFVAVPRRNPETGGFELYYFYKNTTIDPETTDVSSHEGAAKLEITKQGDAWVLTGQNMTNRQWRKGMNTAGSLTLERFSDDPKADFSSMPQTVS